MAKNAVKVGLDWKWKHFSASDTWVRDLLPKLAAKNITEKGLAGAVYVIRLAGKFAVHYPTGISSCIYIGRGNIKARLTGHKKWLSDILELAPDGEFEVGIVFPKVQNSAEAYKDVEAHLIEEFWALFGTAPMANSIYPSRTNPHYVYDKKLVNAALKRGAGTKFLWAIYPMKSNSLCAAYYKTHST